MNSVPLATFHLLGPAQCLQQRLQEAGIPAVIRDESRVERFWFIREPLAAIHIEVPKMQYLGARQLIEKWGESDEIMREAMRCPECRSSRVEFPQLTRKFVTPGMSSLLMLLGLIPRQFYCMDCHFTWSKTTVPVRELDILGWPLDSRLWHSGKKRPVPPAVQR